VETVRQSINQFDVDETNHETITTAMLLRPKRAHKSISPVKRTYMGMMQWHHLRPVTARIYNLFEKKRWCEAHATKFVMMRVNK
jgi:hypothetical protein